MACAGANIAFVADVRSRLHPQPVSLGAFGSPAGLAWALVASGRRGVAFLDSGLAMGGLGRFSFIAFDPFMTLRSRDTGMAALDLLRRELKRFQGEPDDGGRTALPFAGGAIGYLSYELGAQLEGVAAAGEEDLGLPELAFGFYDGVIAHDHLSGKTWLAANPVAGANADMIWRRLREAVEEAAHAPGCERQNEKDGGGGGGAVMADMARTSYDKAVCRIKEYIASGDVYQVNFTQRFSSPFAGGAPEAMALHRRLRERSPAPFAAYLDFGDHQVVSSSPERFLRKRGAWLETRPIKGTRPRGADAEADIRLRDELAASEKDRAELLMIVDLARNDLGRVCRAGSVKVDRLFDLEQHPMVHHLVTEVRGELAPGHDVFDAIRAAFPGGSITGAPKIRAMQIIRELEPCRRHVYTGALGWISFDGDADLNIAIRTITCAQGRAFYHAGGGIVWDSVASAEYQESLDKGRAMRAALEARS